MVIRGDNRGGFSVYDGSVKIAHLDTRAEAEAFVRGWDRAKGEADRLRSWQARVRQTVGDA